MEGILITVFGAALIIWRRLYEKFMWANFKDYAVVKRHEPAVKKVIAHATWVFGVLCVIVGVALAVRGLMSR
ncbi:hypothetical protein E2F48_13700 [Arthrobacter crusticola]|uniref:Uncharacterized protein n=1 Tax=Arthrobacter crusticola TaxID=2547960 RepID=A0A4R5TUU8_9MICC|nr:hypothetical protein [Arthrobacter crusticola]TDK24846.1 hypothetical protein E2F48_13700 [Arthrobacter crusticola]